jgi:hypothetical protein
MLLQPKSSRRITMKFGDSLALQNPAGRIIINAIKKEKNWLSFRYEKPNFSEKKHII